MSSSTRLDEALDFLRGLWAVDQALHGASKRMEKRLGVTGPQRFLLRLVYTHPGVVPTELASLMHLHKSTISGFLRRLEAKKLIRRKGSNADGRSFSIELTAPGRELATLRSGTVEADIRLLLERLDARQIAATKATWQSLVEALSGRHAMRSSRDRAAHP